MLGSLTVAVIGAGSLLEDEREGSPGCNETGVACGDLGGLTVDMGIGGEEDKGDDALLLLYATEEKEPFGGEPVITDPVLLIFCCNIFKGNPGVVPLGDLDKRPVGLPMALLLLLVFPLKLGIGIPLGDVDGAVKLPAGLPQVLPLLLPPLLPSEKLPVW